MPNNTNKAGQINQKSKAVTVKFVARTTVVSRAANASNPRGEDATGVRVAAQVVTTAAS